MSDSHDAHEPHGPGPSLILPPHVGSHEEEGGEGWLVSYADMMTLLVGFFVILNSFSTIDSEKLENVKKDVAKEFGGVYQAPFKEMSDRLREELKKLGLGDKVVIKQSDAGVEISFLGAVFFNTGSADLKPESMVLLNNLIPVIKAEKTDFDVTVEGHTDDVPISEGALYRNNWELSSIRACRVIDVFAEAGFNHLKLTAVGYGDAHPLLPNRDANGNAIPENQTQNRRVLIKLLKPAVASLGPSAPNAVPKPPVGR